MEKTNKEQFKTTIGGQALIEGIMMRGPKLDAIVVRGKDGITVETKERRQRRPGSVATWPLIRGVVNFFDAQVAGVKALLRSADLSPEETQETPSKLDMWLEKRLGDQGFQKFVIGAAVAMGLGLSIVLFFLLPMVIGSLIAPWIGNLLLQNLLEGVIRIVIFSAYIFLASRMQEMKRVFSYHGAEHKTIRCYEAGLPLTVENVRKQPKHHPRCGTSFLFVVIFVSIIVSSIVFGIWPMTNALMRTGVHLLLLPLVVGITYEFNRWVGRHVGESGLAKILTAPGMWLQNFTTNEPEDGMIEVAIRAMELVLPEEKGKDEW